MVEKEQQPEKKKRGLFRRIFKWIGLGLLLKIAVSGTNYGLEFERRKIR